MPALVMTSWSFPFTTTFADTTCDHPAGSPAENQSSPDRAASIRCGAVAPSITQTPTSSGPGTRDAVEPTRSTMTVIPSASDVGAGGVTRIAVPNEDPLRVEELPDARAHRSNGLGSPLVHHERHGLLASRRT